MKKLKIAVLGFGNAGQAFAKLLIDKKKNASVGEYKKKKILSK